MNTDMIKREFIIYAPDVHQGDAVGNHCLGVYRLAKRLGFEPKISAIRSTYDKSIYETKSVDSVINNTSDDQILFVSYSIYDENLESLISKKCRKICFFHNVTTPNLLEEFEPVTAELCRRSKQQFYLLDKFDLLICNSEFTKKSLNVVGEKALVIPPVFPDQLGMFETNHNAKPESNRDTLTYVGRIVPHKKVEDLITVVSQVKEKYGKRLKLNIIGNECNHIYSSYLRDLTRQLDVEELCQFYGSISLVEMLSILSDCDLYVTASEHEGFCIPVLEASLMGIPSIVKGGSATEELLSNKTYMYLKPEEAVSKVYRLLQSEQEYAKSCSELKFTVERVLNLVSDDNWKRVLERII